MISHVHKNPKGKKVRVTWYYTSLKHGVKNKITVSMKLDSPKGVCC